MTRSGIHVRLGTLVPATHAHYTLEMLLDDICEELKDHEIEPAIIEQIRSSLRKSLITKMNYVQKGVDSALITDLVSLAALEKITTAIVVTNDADFAAALKFAQATGVEIVLAGPRDGANHHLAKYTDRFVPLTKEFLEQFVMEQES